MELAKVSLTSESLLSLPKQFYPWFDVCHVLLCVLTVRKECGKRFARDHPAAALLSCLVSSFAGSLLANPLMGKPMFAAFADEFLVLVCVLLFLAVFFSPGDAFYKFVKIQPVYLSICFIKEIYRAKKVFGGLTDGQKAFPSSPLLGPVTIAVIKGNGSAFMAPFARAIRGDWRPAATEVMKPSVTTKECILAAVLFAHLDTPDVIYLSLVGLFLTVKLGSVLGAAIDPFAPVEIILFGIADAISPSDEAAAAATGKKEEDKKEK